MVAWFLLVVVGAGVFYEVVEGVLVSAVGAVELVGGDFIVDGCGLHGFPCVGVCRRASRYPWSCPQVQKISAVAVMARAPVVAARGLLVVMVIVWVAAGVAVMSARRIFRARGESVGRRMG